MKEFMENACFLLVVMDGTTLLTMLSDVSFALAQSLPQEHREKLEQWKMCIEAELKAGDRELPEIQ